MQGEREGINLTDLICQEPHSGPLKEQNVLLTTIAISSPSSFFILVIILYLVFSPNNFAYVHRHLCRLSKHLIPPTWVVLIFLPLVRN